jgi:SAM-dependent methyltransferase
LKAQCGFERLPTYSCLRLLLAERGFFYDASSSRAEFSRPALAARLPASTLKELQMATPTSRLGTVLRDPSRLRAAVASRLQVPIARWGRLHDLRWRLNSRQALFTQIYESESWGSRESGSGTGSELRATDNIRERLPELLSRLGAQSVLDAPCGDWNWMRHIDLPIKDYYGVDIVPRVIQGNEQRFGGDHRRFTVADLTRDTLPRADVILCRGCLVHVSFQECAMILDNFRSTGATWLLLNTYPEVRRNVNQFTGKQWRRLNFRLPPFEFPEPMEKLPDGGEVDPSQLALWRLQELPPMQAADRGRGTY